MQACKLSGTILSHDYTTVNRFVCSHLLHSSLALYARDTDQATEWLCMQSLSNKTRDRPTAALSIGLSVGYKLGCSL